MSDYSQLGWLKSSVLLTQPHSTTISEKPGSQTVSLLFKINNTITSCLIELRHSHGHSGQALACSSKLH